MYIVKKKQFFFTIFPFYGINKNPITALIQKFRYTFYQKVYNFVNTNTQYLES